MIQKSKLLYAYENGSTHVEIYEDGTKIRTTLDNVGVAYQPESIDLKITNYCDMGCAFCHEVSTVKGKHADLDSIKQMLTGLRPGTELAIGGGNPLDYPELKELLSYLISQGFICNLTVNQMHLEDPKYMEILVSCLPYLRAVGISIVDPKASAKFINLENVQTVAHVIAGVHSYEDILELSNLGWSHILILGFKTFGLGTNYQVSNWPDVKQKLYELYTHLPMVLNTSKCNFDNLAISQLNPQRFYSEDIWDERFMGEDFTHSMYVDAVKGYYSPTSRSPHSLRVSSKTQSLCSYFQAHRGSHVEEANQIQFI